MTTHRILGLVLCAFTTLAMTLPVQADQTGLAEMHDLRRERGKLCMVDHFHYGGGDGLRTKKAAIRAAIVSWQEFTDLEYGSDWARYRSAASRSVGCKKVDGLWNCEAEARPCLLR